MLSCLLLIVFGSVTTLWAATTHCTPNEQVIFSCPTGKQKIVSVCASQDLSSNSGYLEYRFGKPGALEIVLPAGGKDPTDAAEAGTFSSMNGSAASFIRFKKGDYAYVTYSAEVSDGVAADGTRNWMSQEGVVVEKSGKLLANLLCKEGADDNMSADFLYETAGFPRNEFMEGFDIPEVSASK
jgi:hypothetical protein